MRIASIYQRKFQITIRQNFVCKNIVPEQSQNSSNIGLSKYVTFSAIDSRNLSSSIDNLE